MIICLCRNINDKKVSTAINAGATTPAQIMAKCGTRFNCGTCRETMQEMIPATQAANVSDAAVAAE